MASVTVNEKSEVSFSSQFADCVFSVYFDVLCIKSTNSWLAIGDLDDTEDVDCGKRENLPRFCSRSRIANHTRGGRFYY